MINLENLIHHEDEDDLLYEWEELELPYEDFFCGLFIKVLEVNDSLSPDKMAELMEKEKKSLDKKYFRELKVITCLMKYIRSSYFHEVEEMTYMDFLKSVDLLRDSNGDDFDGTFRANYFELMACYVDQIESK